MNKKQQGFTLIELVMVIVILGILAAFAFPKFANLSGNARKASIEGALGAVKSASAITHAKFLVTNVTPVDLEGTNVTIVNGYPNAQGASDAAQLGAEYAPTVVGAVLTVTQGACTFTYTEAGVGGAPAISAIAGFTDAPTNNEC